MKLYVSVQTEAQLQVALQSTASRALVPLQLLDKIPQHERERVVITLPWLFEANVNKVKATLGQARSLGFSRLLADNLAHFAVAKEFDLTLHGSHRLNITNSVSLGAYSDMGLTDTVLSAEMLAAQMRDVTGDIATGYISYGRLPLMTLRRCPKSGGSPCSPPKANCRAFMKERDGRRLPLICDGHAVYLLNAAPLWLFDKAKDFSRMSFDLVVFTTETGEEAERVLAARRKHDKPSEQTAFTRGLYFKGVK
ncbi:MAG: U32 family peptidase [Oscillospiraceae bacterium]|jgi:putative protease|nr:U32 family peptidase [Oscillospiraceae bacterium]